MSMFSENMRRLRFERHMTQEEFADLLGTTKQNISRYESGAVSPKISTAKAIADKLGITLAELSGEIEALRVLRAEFTAYGEERLKNLDKQNATPRSSEWRMLSEGLAKLEQKNKAAFVATTNFLTSMYPDIFTERNDDDAHDTES